MGMFKGLGIRKNDIVRIKFKNLNDIIDSGDMPFHDLDDQLSLSNNMRAYYSGGDFVVDEEFSSENTDPKFGEGIRIKNHFDHNYDFMTYESCVDSIEVINDSRRFVSKEMGLVVIKVEGELFINGEPLIGDIHDKKKDFERYEKRKNPDAEFKHPNMALLSIFEEFITDLAMKESFNKRGNNELYSGRSAKKN